MIYEKNLYMSLSESLNILTDIMNLSSRGLNGLIDNYINMFTKDEFKCLIDMGFLESQYPFNVFNWESELINCISEEYIYMQLADLIKSRHYSKIIEEKDFIYLLESKHGKMARDFVESHGFKIYNLSVNSDNSYKEKSYSERGYVVQEDKLQIVEDGIGLLELASYKSGYNDSFPELSLFEAYAKEELVHNFIQIIHVSLTAKSKTIDTYGNMHSYIANMPMFAKYAGYNLELTKMFSIFKKFLFATGIYTIEALRPDKTEKNV